MKDNKPSKDRLGNIMSSYRGRQLKDVMFQVTVLLVVLLMGYFVGGWQKEEVTGRIIGSSSSSSSNAAIVHGSVQRLQDLPYRSTSHVNPQTGKPIQKKQFIEPFKIPNISGFQVATFEPGLRVETHEHPTMHEVFFILKGEGIFTIDGIEYEVSPGTMIHVAPHEKHSILALENNNNNNNNSVEDQFQLAWFGVTV